MTDVWQPGHTYVPGSVVIPTHNGAPTFAAIPNAGFETGDFTNWTQTGTLTWSVITGNAYSGTYSAKVLGTGTGDLINTTRQPVVPGQSVSAQCVMSIDNMGTDDANGLMKLLWFDQTGALLPTGAQGASSGGQGGWRQLSVTGVAPAGAFFVTVGVECNPGTHGDILGFDQFSWSYVYNGPPAGLVYQATQAAPGKSAATEPNWPGNTTTPVTDGTVTWEGILASQIVWTAFPINVSGADQPDWPTVPGGTVNDNGIDWQAMVPNITDPNCPNTTIVEIASSKIYAADNDIVRYCATVNPLDWTSANDAGYLPTGLQSLGTNPVAAMSLYRSNLVVFNSEGFQMWQVNADPSVTALLDALPIASTYEQAMTPVAQDLLFLSAKGVRSMGASANSVSLEAGDVGMPIDPLVQAAMLASNAAGTPIIATYIPGDAQYWIAFPTATLTDPTTVFVYTMNNQGAAGRWSRYVFPFRIDYFSKLNDFLYIRSGNDVLRVDPTATQDYQGDTTVPSREIDIPGAVQWPWLDDGNAGVDKMFIGMDIVGNGSQPTVQLGYDQTNLSAFTTAYQVPVDSLPGQLIPICVMAPSCSVLISYSAAPWQLLAVNLWVLDQAPAK